MDQYSLINEVQIIGYVWVGQIIEFAESDGGMLRSFFQPAMLARDVSIRILLFG
jgi:hypothetical protein